MPQTLLSAVDTGTGILVQTSNDGISMADQFIYPQNPPDGRSQTQWVIDCGNAALGIANEPLLMNGGPDATVTDDSTAVTG